MKWFKPEAHEAARQEDFLRDLHHVSMCCGNFSISQPNTLQFMTQLFHEFLFDLEENETVDFFW